MGFFGTFSTFFQGDASCNVQLFNLSVCSLWSGQRPTLVSWGGDYVSSSVVLPARNQGTTSTGDFDGNADAPDSRRLVAFSETTPLNPNISSSYNGSSARFYGGLDVYEFNSTGFPDHDDWNIEQRVGGDRINLRIQRSSGSAGGQTFGLYVWLKADFLNGFDAQPVSLSSLSVAVADNNYTLRYVVKNAGQYYISQQTQTGGDSTEALSLTTQWAPYDPQSEVRFDAGSASFAAVSLNNVEAVGVYFQEINQPVGGRRLRIASVLAEAVAGAPTTPTDLALSPAIIQNAAFDGSVVGIISNTDADMTGPYVYSLLNDAGGRFAVVGDQLVVADGSLLNRSVDASHVVEIQVLDSGTGGTISKPFTIEVTFAEDITATGSVDPADVTALLPAFGLAPAPLNLADVDRNGAVDSLDLALVLSSLGQSI